MWRAVEVLTGARALGLTAQGDGLRIETPDGQESSLAADRILVTVGRTPVTEALGLELLVLDMDGRFIDISREGFKTALDISAYSLIALAKRAEPLMTNGGSIMSLTYFAAEKVMPKYHVMAIAKAALEMAVLDDQLRTEGRSLASFLGGTRTHVPAGIALGRSVGRFSGALIGCGGHEGTPEVENSQTGGATAPPDMY